MSDARVDAGPRPIKGPSRYKPVISETRTSRDPVLFSSRPSESRISRLLLAPARSKKWLDRTPATSPSPPNARIATRATAAAPPRRRNVPTVAAVIVITLSASRPASEPVTTKAPRRRRTAKPRRTLDEGVRVQSTIAREIAKYNPAEFSSVNVNAALEPTVGLMPARASHPIATPNTMRAAETSAT